MSIESETQSESNFNQLNGSNGNHNLLNNHNDDSSNTSSTTNQDDSYNYDTVFPSLPMSTGPNITVSDAWNNTDSNKLSIRRHLTTTQVFHVPVEERRLVFVFLFF